MSELDKKKEMGTYRKLGLSRQHKFAKRREKDTGGGLYRYVGGGGTDRPFIRVLRTEYMRLWHEERQRVAADRELGNAELVALDRRIYDRLLAEQAGLEKMQEVFRQKHGRGMTPHEQELFLQQKQEEPGRVGVSSEQRATHAREVWLRGLVAKIRQRNEGTPQQLQEIWAEAVGTEAAMQTSLEKVDALRGCVICRSLSSTQAHALKRRRDLPAVLSKLLGVSVKKIVFR